MTRLDAPFWRRFINDPSKQFRRNVLKSLGNTVDATICYPAISSPLHSEYYDAVETISKGGIYRVFLNAQTAKNNPNPIPITPIPLEYSEEMES